MEVRTVTPRSLSRRPPARRDGGAHRLRIGVDGEERHAQGRDAPDRAGDGVVDVEELGIEEDLLARSPEPLGKGDPAGEDELQADLVEADAVAEPATIASALAMSARRGRRSGGRAGGCRSAMRRHVPNAEGQTVGAPRGLRRGRCARLSSPSLAPKLDEVPRQPFRSFDGTFRDELAGLVEGLLRRGSPRSSPARGSPPQPAGDSFLRSISARAPPTDPLEVPPMP